MNRECPYFLIIDNHSLEIYADLSTLISKLKPEYLKMGKYLILDFNGNEILAKPIKKTRLWGKGPVAWCSRLIKGKFYDDVCLEKTKSNHAVFLQKLLRSFLPTCHQEVTNMDSLIVLYKGDQSLN